MSVLFVGDSQLKYLHHVQLEDNTAVRCTSGFRVEQMWALFSGIVQDHDIIVIHAGTNNVPREEPATTLHRYQHLLKIIWTSNPTARIIASAVLPRDYNVFEGARNNVGFIDGCNRRAQEINDGLKMIASRSTQLEFCPHPSFGVDRRTANRRLLSRDGLHLTRRGIQQLHDDIQVLVSRIRSSLCVRAPTCQQESVCEDHEEDPIPTDYRDALLRTIQPIVIPEFTADLNDEIIWPSLPSVSVPIVSRVSSPVPSVRTSVSRVSVPVPDVSSVSAPVPSVSRVSAPVPSVSRVSVPVPSVSRVSAPVPSMSRVSVPVPSMSSVSAPVPSVSCVSASVPSVSRVSVPVPSVSRVSVPVPSVSRVSAPVPSVRTSVPRVSAPVPNVRTSVHPWTKVTASMKKRCLRKSRVEDVLTRVPLFTSVCRVSAPIQCVSRRSAPVPSVRTSVSRRSAPVPSVRTSVSRRSAPVPSVRTSVSRRSAPVPSVRTSVSRVSAPVPSVHTSVSRVSAPVPSVRTRVSCDSVLSGGGVILYGTEEVMEQQEIVQILQNPEPSKVSEIPPVKPKGGESYVINSKNADDWRCDQYQWINNGSSSVQVEGDTLHRKYFKIKTTGAKYSKRKRAVGSTKFTRSAYFLESNRNLVLVRYAGDESLYSPLPHGNSKTDSEFVRTCPSVIQQIKKDSEIGMSPSQIFDKLNAAKRVPSGEYIGVMNARDVKQVKNISTSVKSAKQLTKDEIYNLVLLGYHLEGFVHEIKVFPDLVAILGLPEIFDSFSQLLDIDEPDGN